MPMDTFNLKGLVLWVWQVDVERSCRLDIHVERQLFTGSSQLVLSMPFKNGYSSTNNLDESSRYTINLIEAWDPSVRMTKEAHILFQLTLVSPLYIFVPSHDISARFQVSIQLYSGVAWKHEPVSVCTNVCSVPKQATATSWLQHL